MLAAAGAALTMVLTGCGGDAGQGKGGSDRADGASRSDDDSRRTDPRAVLTAAVEKMDAQPSYKTIQTGHGPDDPGSRSEMLFQRKPSATVMKTKSATASQHMIFAAGRIYVKTDAIPGKSWYTMDLGGADGGDAGNSRAAGYITEFAGALAATDSTAWVAEEKVAGRPADHYRGTVELDRLASYEGPAMKKDVRDSYVQLAKKQGLKSVVIDMWVGKDDLVLKAQESGTTPKGQQRLTEEYSDFGAVPPVTAPSAKTVATWDEFVAGMAKS
ncbi:hypothetical protein ACIRNI_09975 [Streptomyces sp. NPDC093546]|uniref:hypothetical protein n=1 Tax=Streptomyces sp. NPDC093546 TaxID=3366040 RepID=UPI003814A50D